MSRDWLRLAHAIEAAREANGMTQVDLAEAAEVSESSVQNLEAGKERTRTPPTLIKVERALGWTAGSAATVLAGGDPTKAERSTATRTPVQPEAQSDIQGSGLPLRIIQELTDGPLLDTTVMQLGSDSKMVIVVKGTPDATPEQIRRDLLAWVRAQELLSSISDDGDSPEVAN